MGFQRSESIGLIHCMEHPIDLRGIGMLEHSVQLIRKELSGPLVTLVDRELIPQIHDVLVRLQLGHSARDHQCEQVDDEVRVLPDNHERIFTQCSKSDLNSNVESI